MQHALGRTLVPCLQKVRACLQWRALRGGLVKETGRVYRLRKASEREPLMYFGLPKLGSLSIVFGMRPEVERRPLHVQNRIRRSHCQMLAWLIDALGCHSIWLCFQQQQTTIPRKFLPQKK